MKLSISGIENRECWEKAGYELPTFDLTKVKEETAKNPFWVHFGAGNIFRSFFANVAQNLLNEGKLSKGIIAAEGFDYEIIDKMNRPHDNLSILVTLHADGSISKVVDASITDSYKLDEKDAKEFGALKAIFANPSLQMATFTITEKGYSLVNAAGELTEVIKNDFKKGPEAPESYIGKVAALLYHRYISGAYPIAMVSTDNCSHNGDKLFAAMEAFAKNWCENNTAESGFLAYVTDHKKVSFPWTMIDKITPRPDESIRKILQDDGIEDTEPVITGKNTYIAPFVNAEECEYLVIEDDFPNGRPHLEDGGFLFTDRETVDKVERMKVCTCLNPLHTALAVFGCLLGYTKISEEMKNPTLVKMVQTIGYQEGLPVVTDPHILDPKEFLDTVVNVRIPNPFMPDTPQRIATDTSQKIPVRYGETLKNYLASEELCVEDLNIIPLVFAGWLRYLMALDDAGNRFELSSDPLLSDVCPYVSDIKLGSNEDPEEKIRPILTNKAIFGVDLYEAGLAQKVIGYFKEMIASEGAVLRTLEKYCR